MKQLVRGVKILGTGSFLPPKILTNKDLELMTETNDKWIYTNLGIKERRIAGPNEASSDLARHAAESAICDSGVSKTDIDLIIVATATPDRLAPSTAAILQDKIECYNAVAFDISAVCSGFLYAMSVASQFIAAGVYDNVLVVGVDTFSKITDWSRRDSVFFGDGAGAAVFTHTSRSEGFLAFRLYTDGRGKWNFTVPAGGSEMPSTESTVKKKLHYFQMNGREVYETGTRVLPKAILQVLHDTQLDVGDIDFMIPHQPSIKILKKTAEIIGLPWEKVMINMEKYANTSGATIPILLDEIKRSGKLQEGNYILFAAVGSGWTYGASILKWA
jgi:3-oxoacyl-[acyl-carrier-protein] synthase III